jgi:hypothetical protein
VDYEMRAEDKSKGDALFLNISGAMYCSQNQNEHDRTQTARTPGVPQISVSWLSFSCSMTLLRPKSAIMISASSASVRKSRFSGFKSANATNHQWAPDGGARAAARTAVHDAGIVDVLHSDEDGAHERAGVTRAGGVNTSCRQRREHVRLVVVALGTYPVEQLAAGAQIEAEIEIVRGL